MNPAIKKSILWLAFLTLILSSCKSEYAQTVQPTTVSFKTVSPKLPPIKEKPITVAVIDTGYGYSNSGDFTPPTNFLCKEGHYNFHQQNSDYKDFNSHGTNISGIIDLYAHDADYCQIIMLYYGVGSGFSNLRAMVEAIKWAIKLNVDFINISGGGTFEDIEEKSVVEEALNKGITFVVAAGNDGIELKRERGNCYYPACYDDRMIVVGSTDDKGYRLNSSNYGPLVKFWELGLNVKANNISMSGTSQATATVTGKMIAEDWKRLKVKKRK